MIHRVLPGEVVEQAHCPLCGQPVLVDGQGRIVPHRGAQDVWCEGVTTTGTANVIAFNPRSRDVDAPLRCSQCQGEWFTLAPSFGREPAVTMAQDGRITGYLGWPVCRDCGGAPL